MNNDQQDEIQEAEQPLLIKNDNPGNVKKTYSLNTGMKMGADGRMANSGSVSDNSAGNLSNQKLPQKAMTMAVRGMSLATRAEVDPVALIERAKEACNQPIKLSWEDVRFAAEIKTTEAER